MSEIRKRIKNDWGEQNQKRYQWIFNKLSEQMPNFNYDISDYILKINKPKLLSFIKKLDIGPGSKEAMLFTVSKYLQLFDKGNKAYQNFQREGHKLLDASKKKEGDNKSQKFLAKLYPNMKSDEIDLMAKINDKRDIADMARNLGLDDKSIKAEL